ncbi:MAG: hypothetical protein PHP03_02720 [Candidatus Pacebacteria bacterium]|nr:hypothetical protein [Candidatus Paceibacterota bacterium]
MKGNTQIYNDLDVKGGVQIASGLAVNGASSIFSTSTDSVLTLARKGTASTTFKVGTDGALVIKNSNSDTLTVKSNNVGIGTTDTASYKLNISGNVSVLNKIKEGGADLVPDGIIAIWSGTIASIPAGWALCDGNNGTPDMRNRFVYGAESTITTGNASLITASEMPSHNHTYSFSSGNESSHTHSYSATTNTTGSHTHGYPTTDLGGSPAGRSIVMNWWPQADSNSIQDSFGTEHRHSFSGTSGTESSHTHSTPAGTSGNAGSSSAIGLPTYYQLAFIMKL